MASLIPVGDAIKFSELEQTPGDSEEQGRLVLLQSMGLRRVRHNLATEQPQFFLPIELKY